MNLFLPSVLDMPALFGFYLPPFLVWSAFALVPHAVLRRALRYVGFYRCVWHPALFDLALYVSLCAGMILMAGARWA